MVTMTTVSSVPLPGLQPCGLAWDGQAWWHSDGTAHRVYRLDPDDGVIRREFEVWGAQGGTAWGGGFVWQAIPAQNRILKLDSHTGETLDELEPRVSVVGVTWAFGTHLVVSGHYEQALFVIDPLTGRIAREIPAPERPGYVVWDGAGFWTGGAPDSALLFRLDPDTGHVLRVAEVWGEARGLGWDGERVWWVEGGDRRAYPLR
jgi:hypothetical protein